MISKNKTKYIKSLHDKKFRKEYGEFLVEWEKSIEELIKSNYEIIELFLSENFYKKIKDKINIKFEICSEEELSKASTLKNNNSWIAIVKQKNNKLDNYIFNETTLVLDDIKDPWNLWTIIRIADWYWIKNIVCSNDTCEFYNPKVIISTMWSFSRVNITYTNLKDFLSLQKMPIYWAFLWWENLWVTKLEKNCFVIIWNESKWISSKIEQIVTKKITIPKFWEAESLNAWVATWIIINSLFTK